MFSHKINNTGYIIVKLYTLLPRPLRHDPRFIQCIYCYSHASKRLVEVYMSCIIVTLHVPVYCVKNNASIRLCQPNFKIHDVHVLW